MAGRARGSPGDRAAEHLSLYQLTIEPDTIYERLVAAGKLVPMPDEDARVLFDITREVCERGGCRPTRSRTMPGPAQRAGTTSSTGAMASMPASAPAPIRG